MDKYEYQAKLEEINKLVEKKDYEEAAVLADTIEWKRVRSVKTLCMVSEIYEAVGRAEDSKSILYRAYRRSPNSRQILYRLTEACVQTQDFDDAVEYYTEYVNISPNDNSKYILKYEIYKGRGSSVEEQIGVLEELKSKEYTEQWAYELAKLYDEAGMTDKCVEECDDIALWFHNGKYVVQALELKKKYKELTPEQQTVYDNPSEIVDMETKEKVVEEAVPTLDKVITKELPRSEKDVVADSITMDTEKEIAATVQAMASEKQQKEAEETAADTTEKKAAAEKALNTVDLQSELASSMREILSGIRPASSPTVQLEDLPIMSKIKKTEETQETEDDEIPGQMNIDDLLTGVSASAKEATEELKAKTGISDAEETVKEAATAKEAETKASDTAADIAKDAAENTEETAASTAADAVLSAPTIDISQKIKQEIGDKTIREYAASLKKTGAETAAAAAIAGAAVKAVENAEEKTADTAASVESMTDAAKDAAENTAETATNTAAEAVSTSAETVEDTVKDVAEQTAAAAETAEEKTADAAAGIDNMISAAKDVVETTAESSNLMDATTADAEEYTHEELDEKEKSMLGFWSQICGMNEQVNEAVTQIMKSVLTDKTSTTGNVILVGDAGNGRTTLAISLAKIISRCKGLKNAKVAKIYAEDLNSKDIAATVNKIAGGVLIIEEAGDLSEEAVNQLSMAMNFKTDSLVVVMEDEKRYMQDLLARNPEFAKKFTVTINVPMLTNDELVEFGKYYAEQNGCTMDDSSITTLYDGIGALQSPEQPVAILDVKEIVDKAVKHANRFGLGKLFSSLSGKRYDENDRVILKSKNFKKIK